MSLAGRSVMVVAFRLFAGGLLVLSATGAPSALAGDEKDPGKLPPSEQFRRGQYLKGHVSREGIFDPSLIPPFSAPAGAHLTYYGGRVVSSMQVVQVLWGGTSSQYLAQVWNTASPSMATFYQGVLNSPYVDWLAEYGTTTQSGTRTNQTIGRGSFFSQVHITPSTNATTVDDSVIQTELAAQIQAGKLPPPTHDAAGNNDTYYAVFFPHGTTITQGGTNSCASGGFCAYHGTIASVPGVGEIYYGVHPDMQAGSGCDTGCGAAVTAFGNYTSVASHEMVETITDAEVGIATAIAVPLGWYDTTNGEIGDICNAQQGSIVGSDGITYVVQQEFSNSQNNCIVAVAPSDFSISLNPASVSVVQGGVSSVSVGTTVVSGIAQSISLFASRLPSGVTASFSPPSVTAGASSSLSLTVAANAPIGTSPFTVLGTALSGSHAAQESIAVSSSGAPGGITNGGFETGTLTGWMAAGASETVVSAGCHGGTSCALLGSASPTSGASTLSQIFTAPAGTTSLTLWYQQTCQGTLRNDYMIVTLTDQSARGTTVAVVPRSCATTVWTSASVPVTAGHAYTLLMTSHDENRTGDPARVLFDDVALQ